VFLYFANRLAPVYTGELNQIREEGSFEGIENFKKSRFGRLMTLVLDKFDKNQKVSQQVVLDLSQLDVDLILEKVQGPAVYDDGLTYNRMKDDLVDGFKGTRLRQNANRLAGKIFKKAIDAAK